MPSIYDALKKIIQGKPVFDTSDDPPTAASNSAPVADTPDQPDQPSQPTIQKNNDSTFPVVAITRTESRQNGDNVQIYCVVKNSSDSHINVDNIRLLGTTTKLDLSLGAGEEREVVVYNGPALQSQQGSEALLDYKTETGDYFESTHQIHYAYTPEKIYEVTDLNLHLPIRDIYG